MDGLQAVSPQVKVNAIVAAKIDRPIVSVAFQNGNRLDRRRGKRGRKREKREVVFTAVLKEGRKGDRHVSTAILLGEFGIAYNET